jgi:hypothetical protein
VIALKFFNDQSLVNVVRRRVIRKAHEDRAHQLIPIMPAPVRRTSSAVGPALFAPGALLLVISFGIVLLNWLATMLADTTIPGILAPFMPWVPVMFAVGVVLSLIGSIISPTVERFVLIMVFAAGFLAIWLGII